MLLTSLDNDPAIARLVQKLYPHNKLLRTWPLSGGISARMDVLEMQRPDGGIEQAILRRPGADALWYNPQVAAQEFRILQIARSRGLPVPAPLFLDASAEILPTPSFVMEYIPGKPEYAPSDLDSFLFQFAAQLARIHLADCSGMDLSFLPKPANEIGGHFDARPTNPDLSFQVERIRDTLRAAWPVPLQNTPALLHGDYWPGNILWQGGQLAAVVDWEDAHTGDPLTDLAISRLDILCILGPEAMQNFTRHYQSKNPIDPTCLPYWDMAAALRLARLAGSDLPGWAAFFHPYGRHDITGDSLQEAIRFFTAQAFEKLR